MNITRFKAALTAVLLVFGTASSRAQSFDDVDSYSRVVQPLPDGSILLHAEDGRAIGEEIEYMPEWQAYGWFTEDSWVEWDVEVEAPDTFEVYLEWSVSDEEAGKPYVFAAGDQELAGTVERTGGWSTYVIKNVGDMSLEPGRHTMTFRPAAKFEFGEALLDLRGVYLVPRTE